MTACVFLTQDYEQFCSNGADATLFYTDGPRAKFWQEGWREFFVKRLVLWLELLSDGPLCVLDADVRITDPLFLSALCECLNDRDACFQMKSGLCPGVSVFNPTQRTKEFLAETLRALRGEKYRCDQTAMRDLVHLMPLRYSFIEPHICSHRKADNPMLLHAAGIRFEEKMAFLQG